MTSLSSVERFAIVLTAAIVLYRFAKDEWPIGIEVEAE